MFCVAGISRNATSAGFVKSTRAISSRACRNASILDDPDIFFHRVWNDLTKVASILQLGILSYNQRQAIGFSVGVPGWNNGREFISVRISPRGYQLHARDSDKADDSNAFKEEIEPHIAFVVKKINAFSAAAISPQQNASCRTSFIPGEFYVQDKIMTSKIIGVMLPNELMHTTLDKIQMIQSVWSESIQASYDRLQLLFGISDPSIEEAIKKYDYIDITQHLNQQARDGIASRLGKNCSEITVLEYLINVLPKSKIIFDSQGFQVGKGTGLLHPKKTKFEKLHRELES